jgi:hypothetical protein
MQVKLNWSDAIKTVRAFVLARVKTDADTLEYVKLEMFETDQFHDYASMDALHDRLTDSPDERIWDDLADAVTQMGQQITDHFADPWNFAPGYKKPKKLIVPDGYSLSFRTMEKLLKDVYPEYLAKLKQYEKEQKAVRLAARKERAAAISDTRVAELAALYNKNLLPACNKAVKGFKKEVYGDDMSFFEMSEEQLKSFKDGAEFLAALEARFDDPVALFNKCFEMVTYQKVFTPARFTDCLALWQDTKGRKRLIAAIGA